MPTSQSENVATAGLAYFLAKNNQIGDEIREEIGIEKVIQGVADEIIDVTTEYVFEDKRRIDLVIKTDKYIYGIEVKLGAVFSEAQLQ